MTNTYLAIDLEFAWDEHLYEAHRSIDKKSDRRAVAVKRVTAAAAFQFSVDDEGRVSAGAVNSWTEHDWGDEHAVVTQLFDHLRAQEGVPVVSYSGLAVDIPVLVLAAMKHGIALPPQLVDQPGRRGPRPHLDLALMLKGGGRTWTHLSQVLLRQGIPIGLVRAKPDVSYPSKAEDWIVLRDHVELDCLLLAIAKIAWLVAQCTPSLRFEPGAITLISGFLRRRPEHAAATPLREYLAQLEDNYADRLDTAA